MARAPSDVDLFGSGGRVQLCTGGQLAEGQVDLRVARQQSRLDLPQGFRQGLVDRRRQAITVLRRELDGFPRQWILIGTAARPEHRERFGMALLEGVLREAWPITGPFEGGQHRRVTRVAEDDGESTLAPRNAQDGHAVVDRSGELALRPQFRDEALGILPPVDREARPSLSVGQRRRREVSESVIDELDDAALQPLRVPIDERLLLRGQLVHRCEVLADDGPRVRVRRRQHDLRTFDLVPPLDLLANAEREIPRQSDQVECHPHAHTGLPIPHDERLGLQLPQRPLRRTHPRRIPRHPHRPKRRDPHTRDTRLPSGLRVEPLHRNREQEEEGEQASRHGGDSG